ncbi:ATP synthase subunit a (mitochondrion) [[Candida] railenensis]|uniref:ATP synthase subunit a n=1 Tax=[Candida] railenensis TaxID=45579 RepID=UPI002028D8FA|nr:ATP synthase subunit a [[Candida] railenensis]CAH2356104.1 ATP synthase subunit a [[Candida] railenensis]
MIYSPLEQFEIKPLLMINGNMTYSLTNYVIYVMLVMSFIYGYYLLTQNVKLGWTRWGLAINAMFDTMLNMVNSQMGNKGGYYFPLMFTLFNFILLANLISMMPYSFAMSAQMMAMMSLSLTLWFGMTIIGLVKHGAGFFALFVPSGTPIVLVPMTVLIETLSYSSRAMSLGLRLSANVLSGHLLMLMLGSLMFNLMSISLFSFIGGIIPMIAVVLIVMLEVGMSMMQAYVFCILFSGYLKDSMDLH